MAAFAPVLFGVEDMTGQKKLLVYFLLHMIEELPDILFTDVSLLPQYLDLCLGNVDIPFGVFDGLLSYCYLIVLFLEIDLADLNLVNHHLTMYSFFPRNMLQSFEVFLDL